MRSQVVPTDERMFHLQQLLCMPTSQVSSRLYPRLYPLHSLESHHGSIDHAGYMKLPKPVRLSIEAIEIEGAYLLSDGVSIILWLQRDIHSDFLLKVFGVPTLAELSRGKPLLERRDNSLSRQLHSIIENCRLDRALRPEVPPSSHPPPHLACMLERTKAVDTFYLVRRRCRWQQTGPTCG